MDLVESKYSEIRTLLAINDGKFDLDQVISGWPEDKKLAVLDQVLNFVQNFYMFKELKPFMNSVYICIKKTLEIQADINDYEELLVKNAIMRFLQEYITYSNLSQKEEILNFLAQSLGKLELQPLIINLGLILKPMYSDEDYLNKIKDYEEIEVSYILNDENEIKIKREIDKWLESQFISLNNQDELRIKLKEVYDRLVSSFNLSMESERYTKILKEVNEMLAMKLTVLSLMNSVNESLEPIPIKKAQ